MFPEKMASECRLAMGIPSFRAPAAKSAGISRAAAGHANCMFGKKQGSESSEVRHLEGGAILMKRLLVCSERL